MRKKTEAGTPMERMLRLVTGRGMKDERVLSAMRATPRERFFPKELRDSAYADEPASIGHGQTISQPYIVALMTEHLHVEPGMKVLELGTGSGYQTAVLARLGGEIYTIERVKPLLDQAFERILDLGLRNVHFRFGDGTEGWPEAGPFDRILIAAGAPRLPRDLLMNQLADGGIAVLPIGPDDHQMLVEVRRNGNELLSKDVCPCRFVKLIGKEGW